jgi:DNA-binding beta-propeller fold protein YncE
VLPDVTPGVPSSVEGLTVGPDGNIYVVTFGFNYHSPFPGIDPPAVLFVIKPDGTLLRRVPIHGVAGSSSHMLGLAFHPFTGSLLVIDFGAGTVLTVNPTDGSSTLFMGPVPGSGLNALTFDKAGNVYVSDSFNGTIWKTSATGGAFSSWVSDPLLGNGGGTLTPPFGANGVEFNNAGTTMFVANTAFHQIIQIPVNNGTPGTPAIFITGINAPDGIAIDRNDNLWVCANQEDEIVVLDKTGKVIAKLGDFQGIDETGTPQGLLFPASLAFSRDGRTLYVSNLALNLPFAGANSAIDSAWTLEARHYTVSKIRAVIPPLDDNQQ